MIQVSFPGQLVQMIDGKPNHQVQDVLEIFDPMRWPGPRATTRWRVWKIEGQGKGYRTLHLLPA